MSWTKRQIIEKAFSKLGLAAMFYDMQPEQAEDARRELDAMVAEWTTDNIQIGYPLPSEANSSDLDQETNIPDYAIRALYLNLAVSIAGDYGKAITPVLQAQADLSLKKLKGMTVKMPPQMKYSCTLPSGAGHKYRCDKFIINKQDNNVLTPAQDVEFFNE
ncbi:packaged DNA stabilization gp4 family protein [Acinetobacter sp. MN12]|uniref:packaged DNA stabilization gp4 family protein n=1 Tax=Acinetobacter sp. MN12 TaxID=1513354 RepID=UPI00051C64DF|nr:packaged DNA stabilization gp4 family protein [Acinetobacter sp. MN12]